MNFLGDAHNFGQKVNREDDIVKKPRPVFWEWLFLDTESELRQLLSKRSRLVSTEDPFLSFPNLNVKEAPGLHGFPAGVVDYFQTTVPEKSAMTDSLAKAVGRAIGVAHFFGLSDLHIENFGVSQITNGCFFFPLDIEVIFNRLKLASQTYILDSVKNESKIVGLSLMRNKNLNIAAVISSYLLTIEFLNTNLKEINDVLVKLNVKSIPIRCIVKPSMEYADYLRTDNIESSVFYPEELEQLERGDIPYFFHYLGDYSIRYLTKDGEKVTSFSWEDVFKMDLISESQIEQPVSVVDENAIKASILQIARTLDTTVENDFSFEATTVSFQGDSIFIKCGTGWKLKCQRMSK